MSQFIVLGNRDKNYQQSNIAINLPDGSLLFANGGYISAIQTPTEPNSVLQYDTNTQTYYWKQLSLSMILGDNEIGEGILWNDSKGDLQLMSAYAGLYQIKVADNMYNPSVVPVTL